MKTKVMFHGERVDHYGRLTQLFKERNGKEAVFTGIKGIYFGEVYLMTDNRMNRKPESIENPAWDPAEKDRLEYEGQKIVVRNWRANRRKDMQLKKPHPKIVTAVDLLRPFYQTMGEIDRRRFMGWVSNECSRRKK